MSKQQLQTIQQVFELKFKKKQGAFLAVLQQEQQLRAQLKKLDTQLRNSQMDQHQNMQAIGADVIWQSWVERSKKSLNLELAQVLAQKETLLVNVKKDYGRLLVSRELYSTLKNTERTQTQARLLAAAIKGS
ncbi:hypothetical protein CEP88_11130 [Roseobacter denitrificans]|uniref:Flagellar FliJ protein n=1 Tax=Roseobacter denitrificans (strain ATCC 33942 / OCh 114) TaxID=375451 RepID=Q16DQ7_ROSDO|nr:hypothetical protein [Roseobacter denitrificans]ABG29886.1 hypothetical protein RD1_0153 [Roseobacter denitrificans OCh 114]AVL53102.1 hypothetical protein CEP88_11130 [Roseobacter denitrificans]SFG25235.1 hypothetical protein SAMN05443635_1115 [Roseobacter denitrificans OCh 114]